ncbi:MAG: HDOD domain-containing protein [Solirubrobacterales bacterium]|nr:HDOD domain-containing protein [Solirubrobacterales bacterium]
MLRDEEAATAVAAGLEAALELRAPGLTATTQLVRSLAAQVSRALELDEHEQARAELAACVRDVGMLGLPDAVVLTTEPLAADDWAQLNRHPGLGAELLATIPETRSLAEIVRAHHERWDGEGYPDGLRGELIPVLSRVIAVCDAFVAIANDRPHRRGVGRDGALEYLALGRGSQFDPRVVDSLVTALTSRPARAGSAPPSADAGRSNGPPRGGHGRSARPADVQRALAELEVIPAFGPACERALTAITSGGASGRSELTAAIESDLGLTVVVLRRAQEVPGRDPVASVADAVAALTDAQIRTAIRPLPRAAFPWQTRFEALLQHSRVHAQAVARATDRLSHTIEPDDSDELLTAALLHDVGKLVLARARPAYAARSDARGTPEERLREERRAFGVDHASLGGLLLERWGLPEKLIAATTGHHSGRSGMTAAAFVQLADMVAHHAHGDAVDRKAMVRLAGVWGLPMRALRDALFDLPHASGSRRRRAERSPLSARETAILRHLGEGARATEIAHELHLSVSTVRSHLHNIYAKLGVADRTQGVLLATERGWI